MRKWKAAAANGKLKTVSYDTLPFELMLMKKGYLSGLYSQNYFNWVSGASTPFLRTPLPEPIVAA